MPPDGGTTIHEGQQLRTFGVPAAAAAFVIRAVAQNFQSKKAKALLQDFLEQGFLKKLLIAEFFQKLVNFLGRREHMIDRNVVVHGINDAGQKLGHVSFLIVRTCQKLRQTVI